MGSEMCIRDSFYLDSRIVRKERVNDAPKIEHVRTEEDRLAERGRFKRILSAVFYQAAAYENERCGRERFAQLADSVKYVDARRKPGAENLNFGNPYWHQPRIFHFALYLTRPFNVARRYQEPQIRKIRCQAFISGQNGVILALMSAAGDDQFISFAEA